jgi:hypothetical protein
MFGEGMFDFCDVDAKKVVKAHASQRLIRCVQLEDVRLQMAEALAEELFG